MQPMAEYENCNATFYICVMLLLINQRMSHFFVPILYRKYIMAIMTALVKN